MAAQSSTATTLVAPAAPPVPNINELGHLADNLARSGFFKDAPQATQAFAKLLFGAELGLTKMQSMTDLHIIEGKPTLSANLLATRVKTYRGPEGEKYDFAVVEHTDEVCSIQFSKDGEPLGDPVAYTKADAERAGLWGKKNWKNDPSSMLFARAISRGVRRRCPEVTGSTVYVHGEIEEANGGDGGRYEVGATAEHEQLPAGEPRQVQHGPAENPETVAAPASDVIDGTATDVPAEKLAWPPVQPHPDLPDNLQSVRNEAIAATEAVAVSRGSSAKFMAKQIDRADKVALAGDEQPDRGYQALIKAAQQHEAQSRPASRA